MNASSNQNTNIIVDSDDKHIFAREFFTGTDIPRKKLTSGSNDTSMKRQSTLQNMKDKPKRALSAYNIFFKFTRSRIIAGHCEEATTEETVKALKEILKSARIRKPPNSRKNRQTHNQISFSELAKQIAEKWKSIDPQRKKVFDEYASMDMERYREEMKVWKEKEKKKKENLALKNHPLQNDSPISSGNSENSNVDVFGDKSSFKEHQKILAENRQLERSIQVLENGLFETDVNDSNYNSDSFLEYQKQQERKKGLKRSHSCGPNIDQLQHLNRRRMLVDNNYLSVGENTNHISGFKKQFTYSTNFQHSFPTNLHGTLGEQNNDISSLRHVGGLDGPVARKHAFLMNHNTNPNTSTPNLDDVTESMVVGNEIFLQQPHAMFSNQTHTAQQIGFVGTGLKKITMERGCDISQKAYSSNHGIDWLQSVAHHKDPRGLKSPVIAKNILLSSNESSLSIKNEKDLAKDTLLLEMAIGDDKHVTQDEDVDEDYESPQEDFWNEGCKNLK